MGLSLRIYSDYTCPFCFLGKGMVDVLRQESDITVQWFPFEVHTGMPLSGLPVSSLYLNEPALLDMYDSLNRRGEKFALRFNIPERVPNTRQAIMAAEFARDHGAHESFHDKVFTAYFTHGRDIGSGPVLWELAHECGLDVDALRLALRDNRYQARLACIERMAELQEALTAPSFIFGGTHKVLGAQSLTILRKTLRQALGEASKSKRIQLGRCA